MIKMLQGGASSGGIHGVASAHFLGAASHAFAPSNRLAPSSKLPLPASHLMPSMFQGLQGGKQLQPPTMPRSAMSLLPDHMPVNVAGEVELLYAQSKLKMSNMALFKERFD